ncbi:MAG TPA: type I glyceraldehyde-3-phosphate dehydrogenase [Bacteroidales bacterium]|jgi:glyceraldehyde 3-phosphate dehydrogenase|nr:type I glyceraldehyde-3-phosphate dehydrogenase [Bacteroidales bacterium]HPE39763.1 type I glyceraldehyde-3-phosphate dehydrogenase [Bacteroidales bacterium]
MTTKIGINGFGRIGKFVSRLVLLSKELELVHINDKMTPEMIAHLLKYDSIHGKFEMDVTYDDHYLYVNDHNILITNHLNHEDIPWGVNNVTVVVESSGKFKTKSLLEKHRKDSVQKVILSCPPDDESVDKMIVLGVNESIITDSDSIISNASCTTNCVAMMLKVLDEQFGVQQAFMNTVHPMTNNQNLQDGYHSDFRRARCAINNIIPTTTSAIGAVEKILPKLSGKFDGFATRVPIADCSFVELTAQLDSNTTVKEINETFCRYSQGKLKPFLSYTEDPIVSSDIQSDSHSAIFDALSTKVLGGNFIQILAWYDNESGYSNRILDLIQIVSKQ